MVGADDSSARRLSLKIDQCLRKRCAESKSSERVECHRYYTTLKLVEAGVIDPTKVVRLALENAASAATLLLLTEATLTEVKEEKQERGPAIPE